MNLAKTSFKIPIVIIAYNRPHLLQKVLDVVRQINPEKLYLVVDGAKKDSTSIQQEKCDRVRQILDNIDWCENIARNYASENLGCGQRIPSGLDWVFEREEKAIILEDDCLPVPSFFQFCQELLERYRDDNTVTQICGTNRLLRWKEDRQSYHFARYGSAWGWATWQNSWQKYHQHQQMWQNPEIRAKIERFIGDDRQYNYFCQRYQKTIANPKTTWDYQWSLVQLAGGGKSIIPSLNLVQNLGFSEDATHTSHFCLSHLLQFVRNITFPLVDPALKEYDDEYDRQHFAWSIGQPHPDSLMVTIDTLIRQQRYVHSLLILNNAIAKYPQYFLFQQKRRQVLLQLKNKKKYSKK